MTEYMKDSVPMINGIQPRIVSVVEFNGHLYVATDVGLYVSTGPSTFAPVKFIYDDEN